MSLMIWKRVFETNKQTKSKKKKYLFIYLFIFFFTQGGLTQPTGRRKKNKKQTNKQTKTNKQNNKKKRKENKTKNTHLVEIFDTLAAILFSIENFG